MSRHSQSTRVLLAFAVVSLLAAGAGADDRDLLMSKGAPPNVLLIMDSGSTMLFDPETNSQNFIDCADNPGSKMYQAKEVLRHFVTTFPDFNMGMTYYETDLLAVNYLNYVYKVTRAVDILGAEYETLLDGTPIGTEIRLGDDVDIHHNPDALPQWPIRFGLQGDEDFIMWDWGPYLAAAAAGLPVPEAWGPYPPYGKSSPADGDKRIVSHLLDADYNDKVANVAPFYYPAYDWDSVPLEIQEGMTGAVTWKVFAETELDLDTTEEYAWYRPTHDYVVGELAATQLTADNYSADISSTVFPAAAGPRVLRIREQLQVYDSTSGSWVDDGDPRYGEIEYVTHFVLYDRGSGTPDDAQIAQAKDALTCLEWKGEGGDCRGYMEIDEDEIGEQNGLLNVPVVPIPLPDEVTGAVYNNRDWMQSLLRPQTVPIYYFPSRPELYLPNPRPNWIPLTDVLISMGRRSIHVSLREAEKYLSDIKAWGAENDPLYQCRMTFIIFVTDGLETCNQSKEAACSQADILGRMDIPIYTVGFGPEAEFKDGDSAAEAFTCMSDNSGGTWFLAEDKEELAAALRKIGQDIEERTRGFAAPIVPSVETTSEQTAYISTFTPKDDRSIWRGHIRAYAIDPDTGIIADLRADGTPNPFTAHWDAGDLLASRGASSRAMYYGVPSATGAVPATRYPFEWADMSGATAGDLAKRTFLGRLVFAPDAWTDSTDEKNALHETVNFIRGVEMVVDENTDPPTIVTYGRDPLAYGWCGATDDEEFDEAPEPCDDENANVIGIEKLGDTFHSTPQLLGAPRCYPCWLQNYNGYRDDLATMEDDGFFTTHKRRRQVLFAGADDGALHAFDAGLWDPDGATIDGVEEAPRYDTGTGRELFAWVPNAVMGKLDYLTVGADHAWTVDGTPSLADVYIDPSHSGSPTAADREWRTVLLFGQRRGGSTVACLDVTRPDPYDDTGVPKSPAVGDLTVDSKVDAESTDRDALCASGTAVGCDGEWPQFKWEFADLEWDSSTSQWVRRDEDGNLAADLGQTWSRPLVGFVRVDTGGDVPEDRMVAFFGGGYSWDGLSALNPSGNFVYGLDIETGKILLKEQVVGMVPGHVAGLDIDLDGFLEKLYFATTAGRIYRIDLSVAGEVDNASNRVVDDWDPVLIFDAGVLQPFFMRPTLAPVSFAADGTPVLAIAIGSGNRDNIFEANTTPHRFYVIVDKPKEDGSAITEGDMTGITLASSASSSNYLVGSDSFGWYLAFSDADADTNDWEKVNTAALVLDQRVIFSTFNPDDQVEVVPILDEDGNEIGHSCRQSGTARTYNMLLTNGNPPEDAERYIEHEGAAMATEPVVYLGADGKLHVIQATDSLNIAQPMAAIVPPVRVMTWKEE